MPLTYDVHASTTIPDRGLFGHVDDALYRSGNVLALVAPVVTLAAMTLMPRRAGRIALSGIAVTGGSVFASSVTCGKLLRRLG